MTLWAWLVVGLCAAPGMLLACLPVSAWKWRFYFKHDGKDVQLYGLRSGWRVLILAAIVGAGALALWIEFRISLWEWAWKRRRRLQATAAMALLAAVPACGQSPAPYPTAYYTYYIGCACPGIAPVPKTGNHNTPAIAGSLSLGAASVASVWLLEHRQHQYGQVTQEHRPLFPKSFLVDVSVESVAIGLDGWSTFLTKNRGYHELNSSLYGRYPTAASYYPVAIGIGVALGAAGWEMQRSRHGWVRALSHVPLWLDAGTHLKGTAYNLELK